MTTDDDDPSTIDGIPLAADVSPSDRWIDAHSVTCALCGGYADETRSVDLWDREEYPDGEAHVMCHGFAEVEGVERAKQELEAIVSPI
jgi:hypothetical protein